VEGLVEGVDVNLRQIDVWSEDPTQGNPSAGAALSDGGAEVTDRHTEMTIHASEAGLADAVIDLQDRTRVSARKYKEMLKEVAGAEQLQKAEDIGWLAALGRGDQGKIRSMFLGGLLVGGIWVAVELGPVIIRTLFGGDGGGGGGGGGGGLPIPGLMIDVFTGLM
jgi:hypothetical protein